MNHKISILWISVFIVFSPFLTGCTNDSANVAEKESPVSITAENQKPQIIEIVGKTSSGINGDSLIKICNQNGLPSTSLYQWKEHFVIYSQLKNPDKLQKQIATSFPGTEVRMYDAPFYEFNRQRCVDKSVAQEWDNIILTANLVKDSTKQKEYLDYHASQFQKWPEVSKGFCNASFQQLLLYKNGRQLMLVISIPKGSSLDELNPKTTENNPRVDDWNNIMKQYQEGIPGTGKEEVWVFLKPIKTV